MPKEDLDRLIECPYLVIPVAAIGRIIEETEVMTATKKEAVDGAKITEGDWVIFVYGGTITTEVVTDIKTKYSPAKTRGAEPDDEG